MILHMRDPRLQKLAQNLVGYSIDVQPGENVLIDMIGSERELAKCLIEEVAKRGGRPFVETSDRSVLRTLLQHASKEQLELWSALDLERMKNMQGYIAVRSGENVNELADVPDAKMRLYEQIYRNTVHMEQRVKQTKWVVLRYPNASMAQLANMSTESFENFYFDVCNLDYAKMDNAMDPLEALMNRTDRVRIVSPGTDLSFSIKGIGSKKCSGHRNIPDGEVFTAPVRDSVQGTMIQPV
jgi:aminopeptidase